ncbi:MAG: ThiF family adenylyltransferase [Desulfobulbus sp.]|nr:ThiF family adenylyltransferase [Desulfobulbus sp.]
MSKKLINLNPDLQRLQDEGYEVEVRDCYLLLHSIPYVNSQCEIATGTLVTDLTLNNDRTQRPSDHLVWFSGEYPCNKDGSNITALRNSTATQTLCEGLVIQHRFSCKPPEGYEDYYTKMTRYVEIISNQARAIDPSVTAQTFKPVESLEEDSVFLYRDSASSRVGIAGLAKKLAMAKVAIVGLGGTGSYVLDLTSKTHVCEIHLFDGDQFLQHNAFRAPGAASFASLEGNPSKVAYYADIYSKMRRGICPHHGFIDEKTVNQLVGFDFVFLCVDKPAVRKLVSDFLHDQKIPFIDVGMELELIEEQQCLIGISRVTLSTPEKSDHFFRHVSCEENGADDLYRSNIQVADLNAMNAALAVVKWKKHCGFYQDCYKEHQSAYAINTHQLTRDETISL